MTALEELEAEERRLAETKEAWSHLWPKNQEIPELNGGKSTINGRFSMFDARLLEGSPKIPSVIFIWCHIVFFLNSNGHQLENTVPILVDRPHLLFINNFYKVEKLVLSEASKEQQQSIDEFLQRCPRSWDGPLVAILVLLKTRRSKVWKNDEN